jgi:hypothetical protein
MLDTQEMRSLQFAVAETRTAVCPTCGDQSDFSLCGIQEWPVQVAEKAGLPTTMSVWSCTACETTLLEPNLHFDD